MTDTEQATQIETREEYSIAFEYEAHRGKLQTGRDEYPTLERATNALPQYGRASKYRRNTRIERRTVTVTPWETVNE